MATLIYASHSPTCEIVAVALDPSEGKLRELSRTKVPNSGPQEAGSLGLAVSNHGKMLYASLRTPPVTLNSYRIDPASGSLSFLGKAGLPHRTAYMAQDVSGRWLFTVSYPGSVLTVSPIDANGMAGETSQVLTPPSNPHGVLPHPSNGHVYVASIVPNQIAAYSFDSGSGKLTPAPNAGVAPRHGAGAKQFVFNKDGGRLYLLNEYDATVDVIGVDAGTGALRVLQSISALPDDVADPARPLPPPRPGIGAGDIQISPDGRFLFASDRPTNSLASFRIDTRHGTLQALASAVAEPIPRCLAVDPSSRYLICGGLETGKVVSYAIDSETGAMRRRSELKIGTTVDALAVAGTRVQ